MFKISYLFYLRHLSWIAESGQVGGNTALSAYQQKRYWVRGWGVRGIFFSVIPPGAHMAISRQKGICLEIMGWGEIEGIGCEIKMELSWARWSQEQPGEDHWGKALVLVYTTGFHTDVWWKDMDLKLENLQILLLCYLRNFKKIFIPVDSNFLFHKLRVIGLPWCFVNIVGT